MIKKYYFPILLLIFLLGCENPTEVDYLDIMMSYPDYEYENTDHLPQFTYADSSDVNLVALKDTFNLKEIAGKGDEISQIVNLMEWVHTTIRHDGSSQNPYPRNTFNIIKVCKEENRGVNCRMLAIVLNEIYLSCGFKSRYVTCKPAEKDFDDCHVINSVYSYQLQKWVYMDPSFSSYFKDERGEMLSIQEVRERIIEKRYLKINDEINHNGNSYNKSEYKTYMTKNLFRLNCSVRSEFDYESGNNLEFVELVPKGYLDSLYIDRGRNTNYYTSNPDYFWEN